jgi:hypothetical protein
MSSVDALCRSWLDLRWHADPVAASIGGERTHDGRYGRFDADAMRETAAALRALAAAAEDLDVESADEEIDRTALLDAIRVDGQRLEHERPHERDPHWWLQHGFEGLWVFGARGEPADSVAPALLARLEALPDFLAAARRTLHRPALVHVDSALASLGGGGAMIADLVGRTAGAVTEADLRDKLMLATSKALHALHGFGTALSQEIEPDDDPHAFALGEMPFTVRLHHEHALQGGAPELYRWAMRQREELQAHLEAEARGLAGHDDWRALVVQLVEEGPAPADLAGAARAELERLHRLLDAHGAAGTLTLPAAALTPGHLQSLYPIACYRPPVAGAAAGTVCLTPDADQTLGEHAAAMLPVLIARDGLPGRALFDQRAAAAPTLVRRTLRAASAIGAFALAGPELVDELGGWTHPAQRLARLLLELQAMLRVEIDVGLHTRGMSRGEAIDLLVAHLPMTRRTADAEVRRCCAAPTHHLCDAIGRRELRRLRRDAERAFGPDLAVAQFLDRYFVHGGLPVPLVRWGMGVDA